MRSQRIDGVLSRTLPPDSKDWYQFRYGGKTYNVRYEAAFRVVQKPANFDYRSKLIKAAQEIERRGLRSKRFRLTGYIDGNIEPVPWEPWAAWVSLLLPGQINQTIRVKFDATGSELKGDVTIAFDAVMTPASENA